MVLHPLKLQMSIIESYYFDGQYIIKTNLIDENTYNKDKALLNIIKELYNKQDVLETKYDVSIHKDMYAYIYNYLHLYPQLDKEDLDIILYDEICTILPTFNNNQFPSYIPNIYFIDDDGIQIFGEPKENEVIDSIKKLIKNIED